MSDTLGPQERGDRIDMLAISVLSQVLITDMMLAASRNPQMNWQDLCYAATVAMKGLALQGAERLGRSDADMLDGLRKVIDIGLQQSVMIEVVGRPPAAGGSQ
jgi:hypothetical protein